MSEHFVIELARRTIATIAMMAAPTIGAVMVVGILVNIVQTITQIKDQSLTFVPKLVVVGIILVLAVPWYLQVLEGFVLSMFALAAECGP